MWRGRALQGDYVAAEVERVRDMLMREMRERMDGHKAQQTGIKGNIKESTGFSPPSVWRL